MNSFRSILFLLILAFTGISEASAQLFYFGRNKVQYTEFTWKVLRTDHFDIYYYTDMRELAERGAYIAEESYKINEQLFNHNVNVRIPLIFYSSHLHFQQTNTTAGFIPEGVGGFFEFLKGRVVIPFDGSYERFRHVIHHELIHVFMTSKINRILIDHRLTLDQGPPLWFTEGLAEFWSTEWDTQAEMVMRDAVLNTYVVPLDNIERIYGSFLMYKEGQKILEFISERYGKEKILLLMENFWKSSSFNEVMKMTLGKDYKEFDEEWMYALKKKYYPVMTATDLPHGVAKKVIDEGFNTKPVYCRRNGKREIYFIGNHTGYTNLYRIPIDVEKPEPEVVIAGERTDEFEAFHLLQNKPDISRDGRLAFVTKSGETDALHIYDIEHNRLSESLRFRNIVVIGSPSWSPDGTQLAFSAVEKAGNSDLYIFQFNDRSLKRLTNDLYEDRDPAWSPDGRSIAFSSDRSSFGQRGKLNLFLYTVASSSIHYVTVGPHSDLAPSWSPDGKYLTFTSDIDGANNVWVLAMHDSTPSSTLQRVMKKVTHFSTAAMDPCWISGVEGNGQDGLVLTAFENFSFQLRKIERVASIIDTTTSQHVIRYTMAGDPWTPRNIEAPSILADLLYKGDYTMDIAQSVVSTDPIFGTAGGAAIAMSDVLGNDQYYFLIYNTAQVKSEFLESFNIAMSRISLGQRTNYAYGIFHFSGNRYDLTDPDLFYYERSFGGYLVLSYPLSKFQRIESGITVSRSDKDVYTGFVTRKALLVSSSFSLVADNTLWGPSGPLDGSRAKLTLAYTNDIQYSNVSYYTIMADYRNYLRLSTQSAFATRVHLWYNEGKEARRFFMGGSWDLRGWPRWGVRGQKLWLLTNELRFPFIDQLGIRFPFGGITFGPIRGAIYSDLGGAWDLKYTETLGSLGGGVRLSLGGILVLRYDIGKRLENNLSRFQEGLYHQFFFGWDY
ncbi:MAG: BamA/TamA family outer membrane protein [bacterium]